MERRLRAVQSIPFVFVLALVACDSPAAPEDNLPITRVIQGYFSDGDAPARLVIRSQAEFAAAWDAMFRSFIGNCGPLT
jgi:hypothetical protein